MTKRLEIVATAMLTIFCCLPAMAQMKLEKLAANNFYVRVAPENQKQYLLLPVEEYATECGIKVIADNMIQRELTVHLAVTKVDYYVPFSLSEYQGKHLILQIHGNSNRSNHGEAGNEIWHKELKLVDDFDTTNKEKFRPDYHHSPAYGWMNDPNGMFYKDGVWNLYYQWGPYGSMWNNLHWGHSTSTDLIHWEHQPAALFPDAHGTIFSGSGIVDKDNTAGFGKDAIIAMYTSAGSVQSQSIAYSTDNGQTFHVYEGNPVLTAGTEDFRDPKVFWNDEIGRWNLIVAAGQEMRIYSSADMKEWTEESRFGRSLGSHSGVWECPDLFKLKVGSGKLKGKEKWVLICNINPGGPAGGSATQYFIGDFDGHVFTVDEPCRYPLWQDYGKDHYAAVSFSDAPEGRHTMLAWMSNWQYASAVPTKQFRSANTIARDPFLYYGKDRKLYLGSAPAKEYDVQGLDRTVKISGSCTVTLSNDEGEELFLIYDEDMMTLTVDRSKCGVTDFSQDFSVLAVAPVRNRLHSLRIFIDKSSVEVFGNNGEVCLSSLVFPSSKLSRCEVK